jgi:hypothetical protein
LSPLALALLFLVTFWVGVLAGLGVALVQFRLVVRRRRGGSLTDALAVARARAVARRRPSD